MHIIDKDLITLKNILEKRLDVRVEGFSAIILAVVLLTKREGSGSNASPDLRSIHWFSAAKSIGSVSKLISETALSVATNLQRFFCVERLSKEDKFQAALRLTVSKGACFASIRVW